MQAHLHLFIRFGFGFLFHFLFLPRKSIEFVVNSADTKMYRETHTHTLCMMMHDFASLLLNWSRSQWNKSCFFYVPRNSIMCDLNLFVSSLEGGHQFAFISTFMKQHYEHRIASKIHGELQLLSAMNSCTQFARKTCNSMLMLQEASSQRYYINMC